MHTSWEAEIAAAMAANDVDAIWAAYEKAWAAEASPEMGGDTFAALFYTGQRSREAAQLVRTSQAARRTLAKGVEDLASHRLSDSDVFRVFAALVGPGGCLREWRRRRQLDSVADSCSFIRSAVREMIEQEGREAVRETLAMDWPLAELREEELEAFVRALAEGATLSWELLGRLGPAAAAAADRLARRGVITKYWDASEPPLVIAAGTIAADVRQRMAALLEPVRIAADLRDAGLKAAEIHGAASLRGAAGDRGAFLNDDGRWPWELVHGLSSELLKQSAAEGAKRILAVPLIRLLHLGLILEAPSLRSALERPEDYLVPEVLLYVLGQEGATYTPELRVERESGRRWRARWAESTAEALATIFLEDSVHLQLATLARIPERREEKTPDFQATTADDEPIVFETKGATHWRTHLAQRREAREQVQKVGGRPSARWAVGGRAFACSLFASVKGEEAASLFHVEDPPFAFRGWFREGWEEVARRRHCAGLLEACEEYDMARALLDRGEPSRQGDTARFSPAPEGQGPSFRGRFDRLEDFARRLAHPSPESFRGLRMFRGVGESIFEELQHGSVPTRSSLAERRGETERAAGVVRGGDGAPRGVYSRLADGAMLAFEVE